MVISGVLYMLYRYPQKDGIVALNIEGLQVIAIAHTIGAFLLVAFVIVHLYLITTGHSILTNLQAMLTGYEELEDE
jgi:thiosulfate reductase cytochrome b subunit